jgi:hypothetical protein
MFLEKNGFQKARTYHVLFSKRMNLYGTYIYENDKLHNITITLGYFVSLVCTGGKMKL